MKRIGSIVLLVLTASMVLGQESIKPPLRGPDIDEEHTKWIDSVITSILTIKPGATRKDLLRVFKEEGGISSRTRRKYVYKECPYIKVDVEFAPVGDQDKLVEEMPEDKVTSISRPYLEYGITD
jgi:hypothetical protein